MKYFAQSSVKCRWLKSLGVLHSFIRALKCVKALICWCYQLHYSLSKKTLLRESRAMVWYGIRNAYTVRFTAECMCKRSCHLRTAMLNTVILFISFNQKTSNFASPLSYTFITWSLTQKKHYSYI